MALHFMPNVDIRMMSSQALLALVVASECYWEEVEHCLVTSVKREGTFLEKGYHSTGNAVDIAVRRMDGTLIPTEKMDRIIHQLRIRLGRSGGGQYDVVDERASHSSANWTGAHVHIEFDPK